MPRIATPCIAMARWLGGSHGRRLRQRRLAEVHMRHRHKALCSAAYAVVGLLFLASCDSPEAMPKKWQLSFEGKTIGDLVAELGPPSEEASAKQFLLWVEPAKENKLVLKVGCRTCMASEKLTDVWFLTVRAADGKVIRTQRVVGKGA